MGIVSGIEIAPAPSLRLAYRATSLHIPRRFRFRRADRLGVHVKSVEAALEKIRCARPSAGQQFQFPGGKSKFPRQELVAAGKLSHLLSSRPPIFAV